ncbi:helix-turn-helix transcriptional regulator [Brevibacillus sp. SYP-B805]|nr:helix-turn-helix transcriptional regulator [Brevibacillus sp. SYP-B805]NGQ95452.1 helix-turn-helix transcriptional regulator [Brevibacillus sp. SYP-B805]
MISYEPLFRTLESKNVKLMDLVRDCKLASGTVAKFAKNESVRLDIIDRICRYLKVPIERVVEIKLEDVVTNKD